jgi:hypothetical protein
MRQPGRALAATALAAGLLAPSAGAAFTPPVELATGSYGLAVVADADAAGGTTAVVSGGGHGPRLFERPPGGAWSAPASLPGHPAAVKGPVLDAAGDGALGIAWRVDEPRRYGGIGVAVRDPGGALSEPVRIAGPDAGGVRHPALAIDPAGDALLAYNSATRKVHLSLRGAIAIAHRKSGESFSAPTVVDRTPSSPPAVALGRDGTGIVAWTHDRRIYVVSVDADGDLGKVDAFASPAGVAGLVAAAGSDGAASVAWTNHRQLSTRRQPRTRYYVRALTRASDGTFGATQVVAATTAYIRGLAAATDADGRVTVAWSEDHYAEARPGGSNAVTRAVRAATATAGAPLSAPRVIGARRGRSVTVPAIAAANGRVALAWSLAATRSSVGVQAAVGPVGAPRPAQSVAHWTLSSGFIATTPAIATTLDPGGTATVLYAETVEGANRTTSQRVLAVDGR